jgi:hypothetical protein
MPQRIAGEQPDTLFNLLCGTQNNSTIHLQSFSWRFNLAIRSLSLSINRVPLSVLQTFQGFLLEVDVSAPAESTVDTNFGVGLLQAFMAIICSSCLSSRWASRCRERLLWLFFDRPSTISLTVGDNLKYDVLECSIFKLRHIYFA